jgi:hypothetical protein
VAAEHWLLEKSLDELEDNSVNGGNGLIQENHSCKAVLRWYTLKNHYRQMVTITDNDITL